MAPAVSIILATHNRCAVVGNTLERLAALDFPRREMQLVVVDNASNDDTVERVTKRADVVLRLPRNLGSCAKALGVERAEAPVILFLDDDSCPHPGSVERMIEHFERQADLGAAGFRVHLPDGRQEASALPDVFVGCGVGFRATALRAVGGLDRSFFMQAEEYDLAFRLAAAGWDLQVFPDLHVLHLKTPVARRSGRTLYYDVRNNLRVAARYLPPPFFTAYRQDGSQRYRWLARREGYLAAYLHGLAAGRARAAVERVQFRDRRLGPKALERFLRWNEIEQRMARLAAHGLRRVVLAELGKNVFAFHRAAAGAGLTILAISDDRFALRGRRYRGTPVVGIAQAARLAPQAWIVTQMTPVHADAARDRLRGVASSPVHAWYGTAGVQGHAMDADGLDTQTNAPSFAQSTVLERVRSADEMKKPPSSLMDVAAR